MKTRQIILRSTALLAAFVGGIFAVDALCGAELFKIPGESDVAVVVDFRSSNPNSFAADEDYAVFQAVMQQRLSERDKYVVGELVFDANPRDAEKLSGEFYDFPEKTRGFSGLSKEAVNDYLSNNRDVRRLRQRFSGNLDVVLLSRAQEDELFPQGEAGWDRFYQKHPKSGGIIYFSNVGFNETKTEALVRLAYRCGICRGSSAFYWLTKAGVEWRVRQKSWDYF